MNLPIDIPSGGPGIIVDLFAGGGGASEGIRMALGRDPDLAINHDPEAVAMHKQNHPGTRHLIEDVWTVDPSWATEGKQVDLLWASPDCTHHSKAKGSAPTRDDKRRSLACVITDKWIPSVWPETIIMENVEEITSWGPLNCHGRIIEAAKGDTWRWFLRRLRRYGYRVEFREMRACDYGAPTIRKRLFLIAKRGNAKIVWPEPTHGPGRPEPYRTAADCIDWSLPCPSIFDRKKPLAEATLRRIAKGIMRYVINNPKPFIVVNTTGHAPTAIDHPLATITTGGHHALVAPILEAHYGTKGGKDLRAHSASEPVRTVSTENRFGLVTAFLAKHYGGVVGQSLSQPTWRCNDCGSEFDGADLPVCGCSSCGSVADPVLTQGKPIGTVTTVDHHSLVAASLVRQFGHSAAAAADAPVGTITAGGGGKTLLSAAHLVKLRGTCRDGQTLDVPAPTITAGGNHAALVHAFLVKYYGADQDPRLESPLHTITTRDRFGLVTVQVEGEPYYIADIGLRMLQPRELFRAQGFPDSYVIDQAGGKPLTKTAQVRMCGNSVCPPMAAALVRANCNSAAIRRAEGF